MPFESALPAQQVVWFKEFYWPNKSRASDPATDIMNATGFWCQGGGGGYATNPNSAFENSLVGNGGSAAGVPARTFLLEDGVWGYQITIPGAADNIQWLAQGDSMGFAVNRTQAGLLAGGLPTIPASQRVYWVRYFVKATGVPGDNRGWGLMQWGNQGAPQWPTEAGAGARGGGFAVVGDGAGGFAYRAYDETALPGSILESVAIPAGTWAPGQWGLLDFIVINSTPSRNATMELRINGSAFVNRNWLGTDLPFVPAGTPNRVLLTPAFSCAGAGSTWHIGGMEIRQGAFTPEGIEIT